MKPRARTPLSSVLLYISILCLAGWAGFLVRTSWTLADLILRRGRGSTTVEGLLFGLLATFGCYAAYLICGFLARLVKYPRAPPDSQSIV